MGILQRLHADGLLQAYLSPLGEFLALGDGLDIRTQYFGYGADFGQANVCAIFEMHERRSSYPSGLGYCVLR